MHPLHYCWAKPEHKQNLAAEKSIASTEAFSLFLKHEEDVWWLCICCLYLLVYMGVHTVLCLCFFFFIL